MVGRLSLAAPPVAALEAPHQKLSITRGEIRGELKAQEQLPWGSIAAGVGSSLLVSYIRFFGSKN
jgi:hypothetical protein